MGEQFDVFLSYNSADRTVVERIARGLEQQRLRPWWDRWALRPGVPWQQELVKGLRTARACAVFVGEAGLGDWAREELAVAQDMAARDRDFRMFMVLLPGAPELSDPSLAFLRTRTWVDLRRGIDREGLEDLVSAVVGAPRRREVPVASTDTCPYRGLEPFEEEHAEFFFGREDDVALVVEKLKVGRFLAVLGPSGSGKSSLLRAGLLPVLRGGVLPGSEGWSARVFTPAARPLSGLAVQLTRLFPEGPVQQTLDRLREDERSLDLAASVALGDRPATERVLLVVDQFEELFTLCPDEDERSAFLANLVYAATIPGGRVVVVVGMRADFYHRCAAYPELRVLAADQQFVVGPLDAEGLRRAIEEPARRVGLELEAGLTETITADVEASPGSLPLLEHVLLELWRRRRGTMLTLEAYVASGGVGGALAQRANAAYASLTPCQQQIARRVLLRLIQPGEGVEDTRRRAAMSEFVARADERQEVHQVVQALADQRLITTGHDEVSGAAIVDITHEALIRGWPELRHWINEDREAIRRRRHLSDAASEWDRSGRDEGLLYRGGRLALWREASTEDINELERTFLANSFEAEAQERASSRRRIRRALAGLSVALLAITSFAVLAVIQGNRAAHERDVARSRQLAVTAKAQLAVDPERSILLAMHAWHIKQTPEAEAALRQAVLESRLRTTLRGHEGPVDSVEVSRDGALAVSAGDDGTVRVWDLVEKRERATLVGHDGGVFDAAFSPDGGTILSVGGDGALRAWDVKTGREQGVVRRNSGPLYAVALSSDGRLAASAGEDGLVRVWDVATPDEELVLEGHEAATWGVAFSPNGRQVASASDDGTVRIWELQGGEPLVFRGHDGAVQAVAFSPDGARVASTGVDGTVRVWDSGGGEPIVLTGHIDLVNGVAFSPDGQRVVTGGGDGAVRVWTWASESAVVLRGHRGSVTGVAFTPDGAHVVSAGADGTLRAWDSRRPGERSVLEGHTDMVTGSVFSPAGDRLLTGSFDGTVALWDPSDASQRQLGVHEGAVRGVAWSADGRYAGSAGTDGTVRIWDVAGKAPAVVLHSSKGTVFSLAFSPDGHRLASGGEDGELRVWDWQSEVVLVEPPGHEGRVSALAFSPSGALASGGEDTAVRLWERGGEGPAGVLGHHEGPVHSVAFSGDGRSIVSTGADATVRVWEASELRRVLRGGEGDYWSAAFSPDGDLIAAGGDDAIVRVWGTSGAQEPLEFRGQGSPIRAIGFSPDGSLVASGNDDGAVRLWDCYLCGGSMERVLDLARARVTRSLTEEERVSFFGDHAAEGGSY